MKSLQNIPLGYFLKFNHPPDCSGLGTLKLLKSHTEVSGRFQALLRFSNT